MEMSRDLSGLGMIILYFFQILHAHKQKLFPPPPPPACCYETISQQKSVALISWLRCGEHDVTCFVRTLHQIFFHSATKLQTQSGHSVHMNVQRWIHTAILVKFNPEE